MKLVKLVTLVHNYCLGKPAVGCCPAACVESWVVCETSVKPWAALKYFQTGFHTSLPPNITLCLSLSCFNTGWHVNKYSCESVSLIQKNGEIISPL